MEITISILASSAVSAVLAAVIVFLARSWISLRLKNAIEHEYNQKLEALKASLKSEHEIELERLRSSFAIAATEHRVRFAHQYDQMASVIAETYRQISQMYGAAAEYMKPVTCEFDGTLSERRENVNRILEEFTSYFYVKRIYLPKDTAQRVEEFRNKLYHVADTFADKVEISKEETGRSQPMAWSTAWNSLTEEIRPLRAELEDEFRNLLGVTSRQSQEDT